MNDPQVNDELTMETKDLPSEYAKLVNKHGKRMLWNDNPQVNADDVIVDCDKYYNDTVEQIDVDVFIQEADRLAQLANEGRINDLRRELANFVVADRKKHELDARLDEAKFFRDTLSDRELRELSREPTLNTWNMHITTLQKEREAL